MPIEPITSTGNIHFKLRFNTAHGATDLYWRVIIGEEEILVRHVHCKVDTYSDASFDTRAGVIKYHMAGVCNNFSVDGEGMAVFS